MPNDINPFEPPRSVVADAPVETGFPVASKWRRLGGLMVDYVCFAILLIIFGVLVGLLFGETGVRALESVPDFLMGVAFFSVFYLFFEGNFRRTPGKLVFGTRVVDADGREITTRQMLIRTACRFIPFEAFTFLGKRGLHDRLSDTQVVLTRQANRT